MLSGKTHVGNLPERLATSLALSAVTLMIFPQVSAAQSIEAYAQTTAFEIKQNQISNADHEQLYPRDIPGTKVYELRQYLLEKNSPMAEYVEILLLQPNWKLVLSISHAESNMCRRQLGNNCWGIGGAKYHRFYPTFAEGIEDADDLIQKYLDSGRTTPEKIMNRWVGWNNQNWIRANNQVLRQLAQRDL